MGSEILNSSVRYAGFWQRALATIIDGVVLLMFMPLANILIVYSFEHQSLFPQFYNSFFIYGVGLFMIIQFGGTPGKLFLGLRIVNEKKQFISINSSVLRSLLTLIFILIYSLQFRYAFLNAPNLARHYTLNEVAYFVNSYGGVYKIINLSLFALYVADLMAITFNSEKRALHDFVAGTYVVKNNKGGCVSNDVKECQKKT